MGLVLLVGCARPGPGPVVAESGTRVGGSLRIDGAPVSRFGLVFARDFSSPDWRTARPVTTTDGRFVVTDIPAGTWDLVVAGPGFARKVLPGRTIVRGERLELGAIELHHGHVVRGSVVDQRGRPVAGARVTLTQARSYWPEVDDDLTAISRGNRAGVTDENGRFRFADVTSVRLGIPALELVAMTGTAISATAQLPNDDVDTTLVIVDHGGISGAVTGLHPRGARVTAITGRSVAMAEVAVDGSFEFPKLVPGDYVVALAQDHDLDGPRPARDRAPRCSDVGATRVPTRGPRDHPRRRGRQVRWCARLGARWRDPARVACVRRGRGRDRWASPRSLSGVRARSLLGDRGQAGSSAADVPGRRDLIRRA